jgi:2-methylaconitate cis-trans-isomerase PrpF
MKKRALPFVMMRGGTRKGMFFHAKDVPSDHKQLEAVLLDAFGSPDRRQIDGLGGADKLTSKAAIIGPGTLPGSDVTYLYGHVGITVADVDFTANCGNLLAAVGVYAIEEGLVPIREGATPVRIHNLNTDKLMTVEVPVRNGEIVFDGDLAIAGVPGTGAPIPIDFSRTAGAKTGKLLPLDTPCSVLDVPGVGRIEASVVDLANLCIYVRASAIGMTGVESPTEIDGNPELVKRINAVRGVVCHKVGLGDYWDRGGEPSSPKLIAVTAPTDYRSYTTGEAIRAATLDIVCRLFASGSTSKTLAATGTACTGAAVRIPGTLPNQIAGSRRGNIRIGHPSGVIEVDAALVEGEGALRVSKCNIFRTARRIAEGKVYLKGDHGLSASTPLERETAAA